MNIVKRAEDYIASIVMDYSSGGNSPVPIILSLLEEIDRLNSVIEDCADDNQLLQDELDMQEDSAFIEQSVAVHKLPLAENEKLMSIKDCATELLGKVWYETKSGYKNCRFCDVEFPNHTIGCDADKLKVVLEAASLEF